MSEISYIRSMAESDLEEIMSIEELVYDFPWSRKGFENSLDQGVNYVFCNSRDEIIGYSCFLTVLDEAHLLNFCIRPKSQGKGLSKVAFEQVSARLQSADFAIMLLEVRESNEVARCLYQKLGFHHDGVRQNYYSTKEWDDIQMEYIEGREDAVLMSLPLG